MDAAKPTLPYDDLGSTPDTIVKLARSLARRQADHSVINAIQDSTRAADNTIERWRFIYDA
jgi:hypothetical protein